VGRGDQVGRVNTYGNFWPFTPGRHIIFDGKLFIPPFGTEQRRIPDVLGTHRLILGDGYLIHGTNDDSSIGGAVSHGCIRVHNKVIKRLARYIPLGTPLDVVRTKAKEKPVKPAKPKKRSKPKRAARPSRT
jgi:lipoprotein-anchoring transpeptidase ErfK/SrfK